MELHFQKYQGAGNDFIIVDNRGLHFDKSNTNLIKRLCDRRFGIGADGLILLESDKNADFKMVYFNADGFEGSMCGNGGRCIVAFAKSLYIIKQHTHFVAIDGIHEAIILENALISLKMIDVPTVDRHTDFTFINTGSPHHIAEVADLDSLDVVSLGSAIRFSNRYGTPGVNVNFVKQNGEATFAVRTYERGVENETLSCGTGVTAVAIAMHANKKTESTMVDIQTRGGLLKVSFNEQNGAYADIWLSGPAVSVFTGAIEI